MNPVIIIVLLFLAIIVIARQIVKSDCKEREQERNFWRAIAEERKSCFFAGFIKGLNQGMDSGLAFGKILGEKVGYEKGVADSHFPERDNKGHFLPSSWEYKSALEKAEKNNKCVIRPHCKHIARNKD